MRNAHTVEQVRAAESVLLARLPDGALMQRAATGLAHAVLDLLEPAYGARVLLLVGSGDNGGDALHAGALLARRGVAVAAVLLDPGKAHAEGLAALLGAGGRATPDPGDVATPDLLVDGLTGIGGRPGLRANAAAALARFPGVPVVAVDVPSGVEVDSGRIDGEHVSADLTVTFGTHKVAHLVDPASQACGVVHLVDLGLELPEAPISALQQGDVAALLPRPRPFDHKYTRGVVGVRSGSAAYPGAAVLGVAGASVGLAGMVRYDGGAVDAVRAAHPSVVAGAGRVQAWVVGSGGGEEAADQLARSVADGVPVVLDADALAHVDGPLPVPAVLTPHAGELARMLEVGREQIETERLASARRAAARFDAVVLLKGRHTVVAAPDDGPVRVNTTGTPWLGTAGAGDVLAGVVGALLATGLDPLDAAAAGAWLHGAAASHAGSPLVAEDLPGALSAVVAALLER